MQTILNSLMDSMAGLHRKLDALYLEFERLNARLDAVQPNLPPSPARVPKSLP